MEAVAVDQFQALERDHWWFRGRREVYLGLLRHHLAGARPARVLDLGCGVGGFVEGLQTLADMVVATDLDATGLCACRTREPGAGRIAPVQASGERLPFTGESFDLVCLFDVLEHLDDDHAALREIWRTVRPGGRVCVSVPAYPALFANNDRIAQHRRRYTRRSLARVLTGAGFTLERNTHTNVLLFPLILPAVLATKAWESLAGTREASRTNLSWPLPRGAHELCYRAFAAELPLARHFDLPAGHSIIAIARRP